MKKILLTIITLLIINMNNAATIVVQNNNDSSTGSLRQAILDATNGDIIRFNQNLIANGSNSIILNSEIAFSKSLTFKGLYNNTDTLYISGNNTNRIFNINNVTKLTIDSMVFVNGKATVGNGGALSILTTDTASIINSKISNSTAQDNGGGLIYSSQNAGFLKLTNCTINNNSALTYGGGGVSFSSYISSNTLIIEQSTINNNSAVYGGGGILAYTNNTIGYVTINNSNIHHNSTDGNGGGLQVNSLHSDFYTTINNTSINNNTAGSNSGGLQSIPNTISSVIINNSTISNNTAPIAGGISAGNSSNGNSESIITLSNSTISNNSASNDIGGIRSIAAASYFTATNTTISNNTVPTNFNKTGGLLLFGMDTSVINCTNSIVWSSIGENINVLIVDGTSSVVTSPYPIISGGYNIFSNAPNGATSTGDLTNVSAASLNLQALANNGGTTLTRQPGAGSVAINAGNPNDVSDAQNIPIVGIRDIGSTESCAPNCGILVNSITVQGQGNVSTITTNGGSLQMEAAVLPTNADDATYTWSTTNGTGSATIDANGLLTATANGTVAVTATANDGSGTTGTKFIGILNQGAQTVLVNSITVQGQGNVSTISTNNGTLQMEATVLPSNADDATYTWTVTNGTGSALISATGLLTASANGTVTVTATANDGSGVSGSAVITISNQVTQTILVNSIVVDGQNGVSTISTNGGTLQMVADVFPANADDMTYTWSVAAGTITGSISATGVLTALVDGPVTVFATANDGSGITGDKTITITNQSVGINDLAFENLNIFPNPTNGLINLNVLEELSSIKIMDLTGKTVKVFEANLKQLNISELTNGIYFLEVANADRKSVVKIVKK